MPPAAIRRVSRGLRGAALRTLELLLRRRSPGRHPAFGDGAPATFFIWNAHSMGGTVRTVLRQAQDLVGRGHPVTVVSVLRGRNQDEPFFPMDARIRHEVLVDRRVLAERADRRARVLRWLDERPSVVGAFSVGRRDQGSLLVDLRILARVAQAKRGAVIATRLGLNLAVARFGHPAALRVAQEHLYLEIHSPQVQGEVERAYRNLDLIACLTQQDAAAYRRLLGDATVRIEVVPNSIPDELPPPSPLERHRIVAVGRFTRMKGFDLLLDAFAQIAPDHPDWELRIIGRGPDRKALKARAKELGLGRRVALPGASSDVDAELRDASLFVLSSRFEPFGIVLLEAMASGLAIVSFACPMGPRELLTDGRSAILAPEGDVDGLAAALRKVIEDEEMRRSLAVTAREEVKRFTVSQVGERWARLLTETAEHRAGIVPARPGLGPNQDARAGARRHVSKRHASNRRA